MKKLPLPGMTQELLTQLTIDYVHGKLTAENVAMQFAIAGCSKAEWKMYLMTLQAIKTLKPQS